MEQLYNILELVRPDVDFRNTTGLVTDSYIDSFDIVTIISYIEGEYNIEVPVDEMVPENFDSAKAIMDMIERAKED